MAAATAATTVATIPLAASDRIAGWTGRAFGGIL